MTLASEINVKGARPVRDDELVLGEDWVTPQTEADAAVRERRRRRGMIAINRSPLARKIITFNLLALLVLVAGVLWLNPVRDNLVLQRESGLVAEAHLIADVFEAQLPKGGPVNLGAGDGIDVAETLSGLKLSPGIEIYVYDTSGNLVDSTVGKPREKTGGLPESAHDGRSTVLTDFLNSVWEGLAGLFATRGSDAPRQTPEDYLTSLLPATIGGGTQVRNGVLGNGQTVFSVATPILQNGAAVGVIGLSSAAGEIDALVRSEREQVLQMFVIAILVSIGLSLVLASTIANPLSDLAAAAEIGRDRNSRKKSPARVRIPDLSARPDEIGRLSAAMRGMVGALYERIDANAAGNCDSPPTAKQISACRPSIDIS